MLLLLVLLSIHFVADFVLQTDWQAQNKSKNWNALFRHVWVYAVCFAPFAIWHWGLSDWRGPSFVAITFLLHFWTDAITSRINARLRAEKRVHAFFVGVGADQLSHAYALAWTVWLLR